MQSHLVSIIIPVYNSASYVEETLKACIKQSYQNLEIIVVNDGSTDNSEEIILGVADERILYHLIENGGACVARNYGIKQSKGELIQFLDADDILDDDKIMHQVAKYNLHGDEYVYSGVMGTVTGDVKTLQDGYDLYRRDFDPLSYFEVLLNQFGKYLTTGIWLVPAKIVKSIAGWDEQIRLNQDGEYFMRIILNSKGVKFCESSVFYYRRNTVGSISKGRSREISESWLYSYKSYADQFLKYLPTAKAKELGWKALSVYFCSSYPNYPELLNKCRTYMKALGYSQPNAHGGPMIKRLAKWVGTITALKILMFKNRLTRKHVVHN